MARERKTPAATSRMPPRILRYLRKRGVDASAVARKVDLPADAETHEEVWVTPVHHEALLAEAARALGDPIIAVRLPGEIESRSYNLGELAARSSPTLGEAFARVVKYASLFYAHLAYVCEEVDGEFVMSHRLRAGGPGGRYGNEFALASTLFHARAMSGATLAPRRVYFAHDAPAPSEIEALREHFGTRDISFGRGSSGIVFAAADASRPCSAHDPRLLATADALADSALALNLPDRDFVSGVATKVREALARGSDAETIARKLRLGQRTLQRRLEEHGTTFSELLDRVRRDVALEGVKDAGLPLGEVAARAGFADSASFGRAFKRWTGQSPGAHRKRHA